MQRPNLAGGPFLDTRPVIAAAAALTLVAVVLTTVTLVDYLSARGEETEVAATLLTLEARRDTLAGEVVVLDRQLARAPWKRLKAEAASMQQLVVQRASLWSTLLADLERVLPWDTRLLSIDPQTGEDGVVTVSLTGIAANRAAWLKLLGRLFTDSHFSDPIPRSEEAPGEQNAVGFKFSLRVRYWQEGRP